MKNQKIKILVTGGAGFVGSHLCETLSKFDTHEVWSLDNYSTGSVENHVPNVTYVTGDTANIDSLIKFTPDYVYHLGEYSRVEQSFQDVELVWSSNSMGTFKVLQFCVKTKAKLIYAGSSTKFGDNGENKFQSPYAWSKFQNTELIKNFSDWFGLSYAIAYFYNVYGPREISSGSYSTVIASFLRKNRENKPLTVVAPGTQRRNFTHVSDIVSGLLLIAKYGIGDDYGIGSEESFSIHEIACMINKNNIVMLPERRGNRMTAEVISKKTKNLGWRPAHNLIDYLNQELLKA